MEYGDCDNRTKENNNNLNNYNALVHPGTET